jgi:hypothetical protein
MENVMCNVYHGVYKIPQAEPLPGQFYQILYFTYTDTTHNLITLLGLKLRPYLKYPFETV